MVENSTRSVAPERLPIVYVVVGVVATGVYVLLYGAAQDTLYDLFGVCSVAAILIGVGRYYLRRTPLWYALADVCYFVGYLVFAAGLGCCLPVPATRRLAWRACPMLPSLPSR